MGRGRSGPAEQSKRKPKRATCIRNNFMVFDKPKGGGGIYYLPEQMMAEMKKLNPRDVARALLSDNVKASGN